jgi:arylsulfatase A-like enzyme
MKLQTDTDNPRLQAVVHPVTATITWSELLQLATWFGLVTGLVEGFGLLAAYGYGWLNDNIRAGVSIEIIWISAVVNLLLFLGLAVIAGFFRSLLPRVVVPQVIVPLFLFLGFLDWVAVTGRIGPIAVLVLTAGLTTMVYRALSKRESTGLAFFRRTLPWVAAAAVVAFIAIHGGVWLRERIATGKLSGAAGSPNVVVVLVDTLRADHMSLYGYPRQTSTNIENIARQGVTFDNAIATASWTLPSHASLLTGRYPHEHLAEIDAPMDARYATLSEVMRDRGYRTGGFSANLFYFTRRGGFDRGFIHFDDFFYSLGDVFYRTLWGRILNRYVSDRLGWGEFPQGKRAEDVNREMLHWVDGDSGKPFFAFLNYFDVHTPYLPPPAYRGKFTSATADAGTVDKWPPVPQEDLHILHDVDPYLYRVLTSAKGFQQAIDAYDNSVAYVDDQIGNLFSELRRRGLDKNTIVIITSDHGEELLDHGMVHHRNALYRDLIRIPLVYWAPGRIPAGLRIAMPISAASLPATVLNLTGDGTQQTFPIPSLTQLWQQPGTDPGWPNPISELHRYIYQPHDYPAHNGWLKAIVAPRWQLIVSETMPAELYDWSVDPQEQHNLASDPAESALAAELNTELWSEVEPNGAALKVQSAIPKTPSSAGPASR